MSDIDGLDFYPLPPRERGGQQVATPHRGVIAVHRATGLAVVCESERSQHANRTIAAGRLREMLVRLGGRIELSDPATLAVARSAPSSCPHPAEQCTDGPRVPLRWGSAATQVCSCGMWRRMDHYPGPWQTADALVEALEETDDE